MLWRLPLLFIHTFEFLPVQKGPDKSETLPVITDQNGYVKCGTLQHSIKCEGMMPDTIRVIESENLIEVVSSGVLTRQDMESTKASILQILAEKAIDRVLIDTTRLESVPPVFDIFDALATQHGQCVLGGTSCGGLLDSRGRCRTVYPAICICEDIDHFVAVCTCSQ